MFSVHPLIRSCVDIKGNRWRSHICGDICHSECLDKQADSSVALPLLPRPLSWPSISELSPGAGLSLVDLPERLLARGPRRGVAAATPRRLRYDTARQRHGHWPTEGPRQAQPAATDVTAGVSEASQQTSDHHVASGKNGGIAKRAVHLSQAILRRIHIII